MLAPDGTPIMHGGQVYDPAKAHEYYMRTRQLKGRLPTQPKQPQGIGDALKRLGPKPPPPKRVKPKTTAQKLNEIRQKLDLLKRQSQQGPGDYQKRTAAEKSANAKGAQGAARDLASLNKTLKEKMTAKAPASEIEDLRKSIKDAQAKLDAAKAKLN